MTGIIVNCEQRTPEWYAARAGRLTGSAARDMLAQIKSGEAAARRDLRIRLLVERLMGKPVDDSFTSKEMQRGIDLEGAALAAYEAATGNITRRVGFVQHGTYLAGCSPDALVNGGGVVEVKCPKSATHLSYLRGKKLPSDYRPQVTHNLWVTGREWCDFVSFDDRFPRKMQLFVVRVRAADLDMEAYEKSALEFLFEVDQELGSVTEQFGEDLH